jgi:hypothetical protein
MAKGSIGITCLTRRLLSGRNRRLDQQTLGMHSGSRRTYEVIRQSPDGFRSSPGLQDFLGYLSTVSMSLSISPATRSGIGSSIFCSSRALPRCGACLGPSIARNGSDDSFSFLRLCIAVGTMRGCYGATVEGTRYWAMSAPVKAREGASPGGRCGVLFRVPPSPFGHRSRRRDPIRPCARR